MKAVYVVALFVCLAVAIQAAPQAGALVTAGQAISNLVSQVNTLLTNVVQAGGTTIQAILGRLAGLVFNLANTAFTLFSVPSSVLPTVNGLLNNALAQISSIVQQAGTNLTTLVPALGNVQTVLLTLANNLAALNQSSLSTLQNTLTQVANTLGTVVGQISG